MEASKAGTDEFVAALGSGWYADAQQIRQAIQAGRAFNIIHMPTAWKIDLFPAQSDFHECELQRATLEPVVIDGPFAETKEQLLGFYVVDCANLDEAIDFARELGHGETGALEIRPLRHFETGTRA